MSLSASGPSCSSVSVYLLVSPCHVCLCVYGQFGVSLVMSLCAVVGGCGGHFCAGWCVWCHVEGSSFVCQCGGVDGLPYAVRSGVFVYLIWICLVFVSGGGSVGGLPYLVRSGVFVYLIWICLVVVSGVGSVFFPVVCDLVI